MLTYADDINVMDLQISNEEFFAQIAPPSTSLEFRRAHKVCVCVCVCVRERERERELIMTLWCADVCVLSVCVCVCVNHDVCVSVCVNHDFPACNELLPMTSVPTGKC